MAPSTLDLFIASENVTVKLNAVATPVAPLEGDEPVTVGTVSSAVVNEKLAATIFTPLASVPVPAMLSV